MIYQEIHLSTYFPALGSDGRDPVLYCYVPDNQFIRNTSNTKQPAILICPGGGYGCCSDREGEPIALHFLNLGYHAFVLNYSTAPHRFPVQLREVAAAFHYICSMSETWLCDPERLAIMGFSAGGHLAAHYATSYDHPMIREVFPDSRPVKTALLCYPVISAAEDIRHLGSFQNLLGVQELTQDQIHAYSCDQLVTEHTPPTFLWHTAEDGLVPVENSLRFAYALAQHNISFALHVYPDGCHGLATVDEVTNDPLPGYMAYTAEWIPAAKQWLKRYL